jgi:hypothetical protein
MKRLLLSLTILSALTVMVTSCAKDDPNVQGDSLIKNLDNEEVSDRSCPFPACPLVLDVEVADWSTVTSITFIYPDPDGPGNTTTVFTSVTPAPVTICADPGNVTVLINGGPATAYARSTDFGAIDNEFFYTNNGTGLATCTVNLGGACQWPDEDDLGCGGRAQ